MQTIGIKEKRLREAVRIAQDAVERYSLGKLSATEQGLDAKVIAENWKRSLVWRRYVLEQYLKKHKIENTENTIDDCQIKKGVKAERFEFRCDTTILKRLTKLAENSRRTEVNYLRLLIRLAYKLQINFSGDTQEYFPPTPESIALIDVYFDKRQSAPKTERAKIEREYLEDEFKLDEPEKIIQHTDKQKIILRELGLEHLIK